MFKTMDLRSMAIRLRRSLSLPVRRARMRRLARRGVAPLMSVFYHRVADQHPNAWTIGSDAFAEQLDYMRSRFEMIGLDELQRRVRQSSSPRPAIAVTFDDGYADNCRYALPRIMELGIPCTYFVTLGHVQSGEPFAHDVAAGQPLPVNTLEQIREVAAGGIEIGLHTRSHANLAEIYDPEVLRSEILDAADELSQWIGRRVRFFAFPYGMPAQLTPAAIAAIDTAGLEGFCSAFGGYNLPGRDAFHIRRFHGDPDFGRLKNWLDFDIRKLRLEPSIPYTRVDREVASVRPEPVSCN